MKNQYVPFYTLTYHIENPDTIISMIENPKAFEAFKCTEIIPDFENRDIIGNFDSKPELVEMLIDNNYWFADHEAEAEAEAENIMNAMEDRLKNSYKIPTKKAIVSYLEKQGYPNAEENNRWMVESFILPDNYNRRFQFWQCIAEEIDLPDFDRWQHFENILNHEISYADFRKIDNILCEYDIEILELNSPKNTIW